MIKSFLPLCLLLSNLLFAQNQAPFLSNVALQLVGNNIFIINYDLADAESDLISVSLRAGSFGSSSLDYDTNNATGDIGAGIMPGTGKQISWDFSAYSASAMNDFRIMLVADDLQPVDIQSLVDLVDSTRLIGDLTFIEGIRHRTTGAVHLQETKDFIYSQFLDRGLDTYEQPFTFGNYNAQNIIGRHPGAEISGDTYILGGHFDTVDDAPGADDNGSAIAGMLEAMRILSQYPTKKTLKFVGFDLEEANLIGSTRYVSTGILNGEVVAGMVDFEMIGYYSEAPNSQTLPTGFNLLFPDAYNDVASQEFKGNFITNVGKVGDSATLMQAYQTASQTYVPALRVVSVEAPSAWQALTPDLGRSDHAPFWVTNRPAIMLTDGANFRNPNYHTPGDSLGTINFTFMANVVKGAVATLAELAEVQHADTWWVDTDFFTQTKEAFGCGVKISPNPTQDLLLIDWSDCETRVQRLTLLDGFGLTVLTIDPIGSKHELNLSGLASGIYFLKMEGKTGSKIVRVAVQ
ncbi:MAG: M28 family peptidase [Saprospiraceae bacterium]|nr:M28 family peptidase [Saprospiraceae bacterium]MCF8249957.1 M28 family peptidase [Saprospiraceae bacterium]MCF8279003.1 M28 family peptidase [Bacteroidales bacterium]MCF8310970.1 M28 family peptidase [Saprospiraceae bacterium]MCF8439694.1 M28 family peptidase [Saprospiraceae bacterium]